MTLREIAAQLHWTELTPELTAQKEAQVRSGHASDLLSDVLAHAPAGGVLVTIQLHMNVIAVALHAEQAAVVFASGLAPEEPVRQRALKEGLPLFTCAETAFEAAGRLYALGLRGRAS